MTGLRWSRRTTTTIAEELAKLGIAVSPNTVARLLHAMGYSLRVNQKQISTSSSPNRNLQFEYLAELRYRFQRRHLPIVSVDSKKRELVGNFKNPGRRWESAPRCVYDHDFRTDSIGVAIPYGIYDVMENRGALVVGVSHDTPAFAAHAIAHWWHQEGSTRYSGSRQLLILADTGGSNSCRCHAWKTELQSQLANSFALAVTVAHYPTGASKWNPIEHRLFSEVSRNWAGEPLDSYQKILNYARTTQTQTGLQVTAYLDRRLYPCGLKPTPDQMASLRLQRHETLPEWELHYQATTVNLFLRDSLEIVGPRRCTPAVSHPFWWTPFSPLHHQCVAWMLSGWSSLHAPRIFLESFWPWHDAAVDALRLTVDQTIYADTEDSYSASRHSWNVAIFSSTYDSSPAKIWGTRPRRFLSGEATICAPLRAPITIDIAMLTVLSYWC
jgi:hypothetical protein